MNYPQTILRMMSEYPSLYPSELAAQAEVFTNSCYEWHEGELVYIFKDKKKKKANRSIDCILGFDTTNRGKEEKTKVEERLELGLDVMFYPIGGGSIVKLHYGGIGHLKPVLDGTVIPTDSWKAGISDFCYTVSKWTAKDYRFILKAYWANYGLYLLKNEQYIQTMKSDAERFKKDKKHYLKLAKMF